MTKLEQYHEYCAKTGHTDSVSSFTMWVELEELRRQLKFAESDKESLNQTALCYLQERTEALQALSTARAEERAKVMKEVSETPVVSALTDKLLRFYAVSDLQDLAKIQNSHIERLQAKLPSGEMQLDIPRNPRNG
jgi:hypothetical protein